jgi:predicted nucleic acid-binding protein
MSDLYDTCVFIDYWRGDPEALVLIDAVRSQPRSASYSSLSATELWIYKHLGRQEEIEYVALTQHFLQEAQLSMAAAKKAGELLRDYRRNQQMRLMADALIAATAEERGERVRTRDERDFRKFYSNVASY